MYEIDFLPIEETGAAGSKSGDAIAMRFLDDTGVQRVVVIDGGYKDTGQRLVNHITDCYATHHVDLVISTHPDQDHINGLATVLDELSIGELLIHRPHDHSLNVSEYSNIEVIDALIGLAEDRAIPVVEPFTGLTRFGGLIRILGPSETYYEDLLERCLQVSDKSALSAGAMKLSSTGLVRRAVDLLDRALSYLPMIETLGEDGETSPRNNSSVLTLLSVEGQRLLFTGDAGIEALNLGCEEYERVLGEFADAPLSFFQAPHHGSRRNLAPSLLNRLFGKQGDTFGSASSFISSAKADPKHPSPKVTNALKRRDVRVYATEGNNLLHRSGIPMRAGYVQATEIAPLEEGDE